MREPHAYVYGLMCGNCDETFTSTDWKQVAWLYARHMTGVHTNDVYDMVRREPGWHRPERLRTAP